MFSEIFGHKRSGMGGAFPWGTQVSVIGCILSEGTRIYMV